MWGRNVCLYLKYLFESYITDVTLADEDTNSILMIQIGLSQIICMTMQVAPPYFQLMQVAKIVTYRIGTTWCSRACLYVRFS